MSSTKFQEALKVLRETLAVFEEGNVIESHEERLAAIQYLTEITDFVLDNELTDCGRSCGGQDDVAITDLVDGSCTSEVLESPSDRGNGSEDPVTDTDIDEDDTADRNHPSSYLERNLPAERRESGEWAGDR